MEPSSDSPPNTAPGVVYREVLRTPWWWYVVAVFIASLLAAEFHIAGLRLTDWIPFGTLIPLSIAIVFFLGRNAIEVRDGELHVRGAHLPLRFVSGAVALDARTLRLIVGREGDPAAYVQIRPWVGPGVQVWIDDDDDPTPYWLISTRHPDRLVSVLRAAL